MPMASPEEIGDRVKYFAFFTGISRLRDTGVFGGLDNLTELSRDRKYATLCGFCEDELPCYFGESICKLASANGLSSQETIARLREFYGDYRFALKGERVYNPLSLLQTFSQRKFDYYQLNKGISGSITLSPANIRFDLNELVNAHSEPSSLYDENDLVSLLYQHGYLTMKGYDSKYETCTLGFPNREVEEPFLKFLLPFCSGRRKAQNGISSVGL